MQGSKDNQNAASRPQSSKESYGKVSTINQTKPREQVELRKYPKRRTDESY